MFRGIVAVLLIASSGAALLTQACSSSSGSRPPGSSSGTPIGPAGGSTTATDGSSVAVPAGAVGSGSTVNVSISLAPDAPAPPADDGIVVGPTYLLAPEGQQFQTPVTLRLVFDPTKLPAGSSPSDVAIFTSPATGTPSYAPLPTTVADATHVTAQTTHFSYAVAVARPTAGADAGGVDGGDGAPVADGPADAAFACTQPADPAPVISQTAMCAPPPTMIGGTILDGTYYLTSSVVYGTGDSGCAPGNPTAQGTVIVSGGMISLVYTTPSDAWFVGPYTTSGNVLTLDTSCADGGVPSGATAQYTATSTALALAITVSSGVNVGTLTRQ